MLFQRRHSERMFEAYIRKRFKANSAPFDISATSAFKLTKPLDIRIGAQLQQQQQQQQQPLISPITGQPLSHVPAPLLLSSSTLSAAGSSSYRLARSSTQPLQSPRVVHLAAQGAGTSPSTSSLTNSPQSLLRQHSVSDSVSLSEQLTLSVGNDSEHIFEMSGLDNDSALGEDASTATQSSGVGVARSSSVRARANMFQQLQEQSRSRREAAGREQLTSRSLVNSQATSHHSPPPSAAVDAVALHTSVLNDETTSTPNTTQDATDVEFEPSSLSLAERLAFFSSLCEGAACGSGGNIVATGSARLSSSSRSPPYTSMMERTPRGSTTGSSSASVTPTPMECSPIIHDLKLPPEQEQAPEQEQEEEQEPLHNGGFHELSRSATEPTTTTATITTPLLDAAPTAARRVRLRTVGKLVLPDTFLTDRNNKNNNSNNNGHRNSCLGRMQTLEDIHISMGVRTIGKIKSPFIEQQQQQQSSTSTPTDTSQSKSAKMELHSTISDSSDSGKENCAANQQKREEESQTTSQHIPELRRKLTHLAQITVQQKAPQINRRHTTELGGGGGSNRSANRSQVDERFAKYFGLDESYNSTTTLLKTRSMPAKTQQQQPQEALNEHVRLPHPLQGFGFGLGIVQRRRELLKRTRAMSFETSGCVSPTAMPSPKRGNGNLSRGGSIASYEDIVITADELHAAGQEFRRLCGEILGT
ncbi:putative uncharacterized protein DDB_G0277255 isoform X13 [Drosophila montana]|uniref:putative uncharacterized protein DDB_G0277255 isoform X13 n=1 Tax=Drosophila montana TaxID=40370 RepID=UPI00313F3CFC